MTHLISTKARLKRTAEQLPFTEEAESNSQHRADIQAPALSASAANRASYFRRKYAIDRFAGAVLLVLSSPLTLTLFLLVKLTSPGPGFYRQRRVGLNGETFEIVKLRSMVKNAERPGQAVWCVKNDARVTWLGRILRKLHLDELPQLWNVAMGEMSLVGPRPERPEICENLAEEIEGYYLRNTVKPGVTGLSQINLPPDETIEDVRRKQILDLRYIEEANFWLDTRMILATAMRMIGFGGETVIKTMKLCRRDYLRQASEKHATYLDGDELSRFDDSEPVLAVATPSPRLPR